MILLLIVFSPVPMSVHLCKTPEVLQGTIDQSQDQSDGSEKVNEYAWQEFVPKGENLWYVQVKIHKVFLWPSDLWLSIEKPLGTVLSSTSLPCQSIPWETCDWVTFDFSDIPLERGQTYYIVLSHEPGGTYGWCGAWGDPYPSGESSFDPEWDWCFRTIVDKSKEKHSSSTEKKWIDPFMINICKNKEIKPSSYQSLEQFFQRFPLFAQLLHLPISDILLGF